MWLPFFFDFKFFSKFADEPSFPRFFLSSHVFLTPTERAAGRGAHYPGSPEELIYDRLMEAHETAHQWWGDAIFWQSFRETSGASTLMAAARIPCASMASRFRSIPRNSELHAGHQ